MSGPLPEKVIDSLSNSKFIHLATSYKDRPHVSLMNFTFINNKDKNEQLILVATCKNTKKYENLINNKNVSVLVHDWVTNTNNAQSNDSSVLKLLQNINQNQVGDISITLDGYVYQIFNNDDEKYQYYKDLHLLENPDAKAFINGDDVSFILIKINESKVSDSNNNVEKFN